jgi:hypothetical protein
LALWEGYKASFWTCFAACVVSSLICAGGMRGLGKVGLKVEWDVYILSRVDSWKGELRGWWGIGKSLLGWVDCVFGAWVMWDALSMFDEVYR